MDEQSLKAKQEAQKWLADKIREGLATPVSPLTPDDWGELRARILDQEGDPQS